MPLRGSEEISIEQRLAPAAGAAWTSAVFSGQVATTGFVMFLQYSSGFAYDRSHYSVRVTGV